MRRIGIVVVAAVAIAVVGLGLLIWGYVPGPAPPPPPSVSLTVLKAEAAWNDDHLLVECDVVLANGSGASLEVTSNFFSAFDGLSIVVKTMDGREIARQPYVAHQSPFTPEGRAFPVPVGETREKLRFPVFGVAGTHRQVTVQLTGGLPGTHFGSGLSSNRVAVPVWNASAISGEGEDASAVKPPKHLSPTAIAAAPSGRALYVAGATAARVAVVDAASGKVVRSIRLPADPSGIAVSADGEALFVTCGVAEGRLLVVNAADGNVTRSVPVGHTPVSPVPGRDGKLVYVCNRFNDSIGVVDLAAGRQVATIPVVREPVAAAITPDGKTLFVANHLPAGAADADYVAATVSAIDTAAKKVAATIRLPNGSTALRGVCVSPDGKHAYVTHGLPRYQLPTTQLERGWINTNALSVIDAAGKKFVNTVLLDKVDRGAANPWGVACTADGRYVCVTYAGTHKLSVIDGRALHDKFAKVARGEKVASYVHKPADVPNDLSFLSGLRRRIGLKGNGPRSVALVGSKAYVPEYFTDTMSVVDIRDPEFRQYSTDEDEDEGEDRVESCRLGPGAEMGTVRRGEILFNDATICFQDWHSCATCHPDGRADGLNWDQLHDGMGNPKSTKSLLFAHQTPPSTVTGVKADARTMIQRQIMYLLFARRPEADAIAIEEYIKSIRPVPSPYLVNGKLSESALRGKALFEGVAECSKCHGGRYLTDMQKHDVGTGSEMEKGRKFDTPTLAEIWRTRPYLYDGRAVTVMDRLTKSNKDDKHGRTSGLTGKQLMDLEQYVLSQ